MADEHICSHYSALLRYTHPTLAGNQDEVTWQIVKDDYVHPQ